MNNRNPGPSLRVLLQSTALVGALSLAGCGGGGGGSGDGGAAGSAAPVPQTPGIALPGPQQLADAGTVAASCAAPRAGIDPATGMPFADRRGTLADEKTWVRSWIDRTYLWYDEVPTNLAAADYATPASYFDALKTPALTASGRPKDRFHYTYRTAAYQDLLQSSESGYGAEFAYLSRTPPRQIRVAYTEPGSPAARAGVVRGDTLLAIDGIDAVSVGGQADIDRLNAALAPPADGIAHAFTLRSADGNTRTVDLVSARIERSPVQNVRTIDTPTGRVGYLQFNDHVDKAESQLVAAFEQLRTAGVADLVLDMRYNSGGLLAIASETASMIASAAVTQGEVFERLSFNRKNPFGLSASQSSLPFYATTRGYSLPAGRALPRLGLSHVTVLTGPDTCSASESVVNGLRGVGVTVDLIGAATCGKPYGFYPEDNCGTTYFAIQFQGVNAKGFGDYGDGMAPTCAVADDFDHALGDIAEGRLAAALNHRATGACPVTASARRSASASTAAPAVADRTPYLKRSAPRGDRLVRPADFD